MLLAEVEVVERVVQSGVGLGSVIAVVCSWQRIDRLSSRSSRESSAGFTSSTFALTRMPDEEVK